MARLGLARLKMVRLRFARLGLARPGLAPLGFVLLLLLCGVMHGCDAAFAESGVTALMRVTAAQFAPGALPGPQDGPAVTGLVTLQNTVYPGEVASPLSGSLGRGATAVALELAGDRGYWILPAGPAAITAPEEPTFAAQLCFAATLPPGRRALRAQGRDAEGRPGPLAELELEVLAAAAPAGALVVSLRWDTQVDLDVHVQQPDGTEIWSGMKTGYRPPPGQPADPEAQARAGRLDFDSNAQCVIDGRQREDVIWSSAPPRGHYRVRVDTASLCQRDAAVWTLQLYREGALDAQASGQSTEAATRGGHGLGAGVLALEFDVK